MGAHTHTHTLCLSTKHCMGAHIVPVDGTTFLEGQKGCPHIMLVDKITFLGARMGAYTVPVDKSTLLEWQNVRTHGACRQN